MKYAYLFLTILGLLFATSCNVISKGQTSAANTESPQEAAPTLTPTPQRPILTAEENQNRIETEKEMLQGNRLHDGSLTLQHIGTIESVPALLHVVNEYKTGPGGAMICTKAHAISALSAISGQKFATDDEWNKWWEDLQTAKGQNPI